MVHGKQEEKKSRFFCSVEGFHVPSPGSGGLLRQMGSKREVPRLRSRQSVWISAALYAVVQPAAYWILVAADGASSEKRPPYSGADGPLLARRRGCVLARCVHMDRPYARDEAASSAR